MTERKLKLVKSKNGRTAEHQKLPVLTPAEMAEAARFKALTAARAARQAMLYRIMAEFEELDKSSPAA
jgi:hypothetical protein